MRRGYFYFCMQLKRVFKILPIQLFLNFLVCTCVGALVVFFIQDGLLSSGTKKYQIGIVGDMTDSYLGFGISTLQAVDDARFVIELTGMSEEEARKAFRKGELYAFVRIPDGLVESIESGANDRPVTYVAAEGQKGIGSIVMNEIVDVVSNIVTRSQSGIYGMQNILRDYGRTDNLWEATEQLNFRYLDIVLGRRKFCDVEILGMANGLSTEGYFFCSILIFFLLLSGINNSPLFSQKSGDLAGFLKARGVGAAGQVAGEYLAYVCLMLACILEIFLVLAVVMGSGAFQIAEWEGLGAEPLLGFLLRFLPVAFMLAAMQFLIYELVSGIVSSLLLQFICSISMGYLSGFFYPANFFPQTLQKIGRLLPTGAALRYTDSCMVGEISLSSMLGVLFYLACFLGLSVLIRKSRIQRG